MATTNSFAILHNYLSYLGKWSTHSLFLNDMCNLNNEMAKYSLAFIFLYLTNFTFQDIKRNTQGVSHKNKSHFQDLLSFVSPITIDQVCYIVDLPILLSFEVWSMTFLETITFYMAKFRLWLPSSEGRQMGVSWKKRSVKNIQKRARLSGQVESSHIHT